MIRIDILNKGDEVISVTNSFIAIRRNNGEVDLVPIEETNTGIRVDENGIVTIGYGDNVVTIEHESGMKIINF